MKIFSSSENLFVWFITKDLFSSLYQQLVFCKQYVDASSWTSFFIDVATLQTLVSLFIEFYTKSISWEWKLYISHHWRLPGVDNLISSMSWWALLRCSLFAYITLCLLWWCDCSWLYGTYEWKKMAVVYTESVVPLVMSFMLSAVLQLVMLQLVGLIVLWPYMILAGWSPLNCCKRKMALFAHSFYFLSEVHGTYWWCGALAEKFVLHVRVHVTFTYAPFGCPEDGWTEIVMLKFFAFHRMWIWFIFYICM